ncbi:hypothetical protein DFH07DRAFT_951274 [Mycena maculata]|uniref:Uncharacterized protein n=1 Tax=Mycena maculata TaxID=230809 RepID=A0AAD7NWB7_9AGAR|nr:hypothetical protein DFH07DRAFT_951274 [Mycena maculata]
MSCLHCSVLPAYTPSSAAPCYSLELGSCEHLLEQGRGARTRVFTGTHIQKSGPDTVVLTDQDSNAELPTYGWNAFIAGFVGMEERERVSLIELRIKGKMEGVVSECIISERGSVSKTFLDECYTVWAARCVCEETCPSNVLFSANLPSTFREGNVSHPLPPSYNATFGEFGNSSVKVSYTISVIVTRTRKVSFISRKNTTSVIFNYRPRTWPGRPIQYPVSDFLTDIKVMPEEWRQITAAGLPRPNSTLGAIYMHLFIPTIQFLPDPAAAEPTIEVTLLRQTLLDLNSHREPFHQVIGRATLLSTPPGASSAVEPASSASLDWEGELRSKPDVDVGSFDAGAFKVQDFIVVDVVPPACSKSQFPCLRHSYLNRLVTDSAPDE